MTEGVWIALIAAGQGIVVGLFALLSVRIGAVKKDVALVKHEVKNDHKTNLRDEQDTRHNENARKLNWLVRAMDGVLGDLEYLTNGYRSNRARIENLEQTIPPRTTRRAYREGLEHAEQSPLVEAWDLPSSPGVRSE